MEPASRLDGSPEELERTAFLANYNVSSETDDDLLDINSRYKSSESISRELADTSNNPLLRTISWVFSAPCLRLVSSLAAAFILATILLHILLRQLPSARRLPQPSLAELDLLSSGDVERHIRTLSSPTFQGRAVGTPGELKSATYIASELLSAGFSPAADSSSSSSFPPLQTAPSNNTSAFFQQVPLLAFRTIPHSAQLSLSSSHLPNPLNLRFGYDFSLSSERWSSSPSSSSSSSSEGEDEHDELSSGTWRLERRVDELIFCGFCIHSDRWDDFKGIDLKGKVALCLVNQPREVDSDGSAAFGGSNAPLSYYGRWAYKLEELRRRQADGVFLLHTDEMAGYGWNVIKSGAFVDSLELRGSEKDRENALLLRGWLNSKVLEEHVDSGMVERMVRSANSKAFQPHALGSVKMEVAAEIEQRKLGGLNVVGILKGKSNPKEVVMMTAHFDHLGTRNVSNGDADGADDSGREGDGSDEPGVNQEPQQEVYHGALDNAAGVGKLLAIARVFGKLSASGTCCARSLVMLSPTAEEAVLLGSTHYASNPSAAALSKVVGVLNFDGMNVWGKTRDQVALGSQHNTLGEVFTHAVHAEKMSVSHDIMPLQGLFFRSDQLPFARKGVPALKLTHGRRFERAQLLMAGEDLGVAVGGGPRRMMSMQEAEQKYFNQTVGEYQANRYHQPSDSFEYVESLPDAYSGAMQEMRVAMRLVYGLLQSRMRPRWNSTEFLASAEATQSERERMR